MAEWRIYVYDLNGNGGITLVDSDLRATAQPTRELNAAGALTLTVKPEQSVPLRPWKTLIVVALDNTIRGTGIVSTMADDGDGALAVTCVGPLGYFDGFPADVKREYKNTDPAKILRDIYSWAQSQTGANIGLDFSGYVDSGVRIGNPDPPVTQPSKSIRPPRLEKVPAEPNKKSYKNYYLKGDKPAQVAARKAARDAYDAAVKAWRKTRDEIKKRNSAEEKRYKSEQADLKKALADYEQAVNDAIYRISWWENPTVGQIVDDMSKHVDYRLTPRWNGLLPDHTITVAKRIGARRPQLRFVVGENVIEAPPVDWAGESYATRVVFLGAGEGEKMIRAEATASRSGGLARTVFIADKSVRSKQAAQQRAERALKWRQVMPMVSELKVINDDNAPFGAFDVGDEIRLIDNSGRWAGSIDMWVRILSITESTDAPVATLTVTRSDKGE